MSNYKVINVTSQQSYSDVLPPTMEAVQATKASDLSLGSVAQTVSGFFGRVRRAYNDGIAEVQPDAKKASKMFVIAHVCDGSIPVEEDTLRSLHRGLMRFATKPVAFDKDKLLAYLDSATETIGNAVLERSTKISPVDVSAIFDALESDGETDGEDSDELTETATA